MPFVLYMNIVNIRCSQQSHPQIWNIHLIGASIPFLEPQQAVSMAGLWWDCSLSGSSVHGILQARILEWVAISFSRGSSRPRDWTGFPTLQVDSLPSEPPGKLLLFIQIRSVAQSCLTLCNPMNRSTPGLPVHHHLPEFTQTHIHRVSDAIQPSHPLSSPSPPAPNPSQHQSLFQRVNPSHEVAKVLEFQL